MSTYAPEFDAPDEDDKYVIQGVEDDGRPYYWRAFGQGITYDKSEAHLFTHDEAVRIKPIGTTLKLVRAQRVTVGLKDTNPKDAIGARKLLWSVLPWRALQGTVLAMMEGALKYGRHNYRRAGVRASVYHDAALGHLTAWWEGENLDPDTGLNHVDKAIASLLVLRDGMLEGNWYDDRPPRVESWYAESKRQGADLIDRYPEPKAPFTEQESPDA